jgi:hypothetical protein
VSDKPLGACAVYILHSRVVQGHRLMYTGNSQLAESTTKFAMFFDNFWGDGLRACSDATSVSSRDADMSQGRSRSGNRVVYVSICHVTLATHWVC